MTDAMTGAPPAVVAAAKVVQDWLDQQQQARLNQNAPRQMNAAEKLDWARQHDQTKMPAWKDPRG